MSARPDVPRLSEEDLDLLISRSLDGDLSPEEEQQLEHLVALDPAAARRKADLAALVAEVKALPEPAAPFAIATRVSSNVAERAGRPGSLGARIGFFPAPGTGKVALVVLFIVGVAIAVMRPAPKRVAEGPVDVILYNPPPAPADAPARAPESVVAQAVPDARRQADREEQGLTREADVREKAASNEPKAAVSGELAKTESGAKKESAARNDVAGSGSHARPAPALAAETAPRQKAAAVGGRLDLDGGAWTVSVRGDAARRWALRRAPDRSPAPATGRAAVFHVVLDASGRVASVRTVGPGAAEPGLEEFVLGMIFEAVPADAARDLKDKAPASSGAEFEIELTPR